MIIGLIREGKVPSDTRVALTPDQCREVMDAHPDVRVVVESSPDRSFADAEYTAAGIPVVTDLSECDLLLGIKEVPVRQVIPGKRYMFFSHTVKEQPYNRTLMRTMVAGGNTLIDYERLVDERGNRVTGFGFWAGAVGAHTGLWAYGQRTGAFTLPRAYELGSLAAIGAAYKRLVLPPMRIVVTGSGRVPRGALHVLRMAGIRTGNIDEFLSGARDQPMLLHLPVPQLYARLDSRPSMMTYRRADFFAHPERYRCLFEDLVGHTDLLINGIYWNDRIPRLFEASAVGSDGFTISTISDVTDDAGGSVPINLGDQSIADPVYGVDRTTLEKTAPFLPGSVDVIAVGNMPNELPRDASQGFGRMLIDAVLPRVLTAGGVGPLPAVGTDDPLLDDPMLARAAILDRGALTGPYSYLADYAGTPPRSAVDPASPPQSNPAARGQR